MKKIISMLMMVVVLFSLAGCGKTTTQNNSQLVSDEESVNETSPTQQEESTAPNLSTPTNSEQMDSEPTESSAGKTLVAYFTWSGNTDRMASYIAEQLGADIYEIVPKVAYPTDYNECGDVAKVERDENKRPEIANLPVSLDEYDTIFIGYPIWWHTAPMIIGTFLENYDLSGKEIYPFTQSASMNTEQFENSMDFVRESAKNANVHDGLFASASNTNAILSYLSENGFTE